MSLDMLSSRSEGSLYWLTSPGLRWAPLYRDYKKLINDIAERLRRSEVISLAYQYDLPMWFSEVGVAKEPGYALRVLSFMEGKRFIAPSDLGSLATSLELIGRDDLKQKIEEFQKKYTTATCNSYTVPCIEETTSSFHHYQLNNAGIPPIMDGRDGVTAHSIDGLHYYHNDKATTSIEQKRMYRSSSDGTCLDVLHTATPNDYHTAVHQPVNPPPFVMYNNSMPGGLNEQQQNLQQTPHHIQQTPVTSHLWSPPPTPAAAANYHYPPSYNTPVYQQYPSEILEGRQYHQLPAVGNQQQYSQTLPAGYSQHPQVFSPVGHQYSQTLSPIHSQRVQSPLQGGGNYPQLPTTTGGETKLHNTQYDIETDSSPSHNNNNTDTTLSGNTQQQSTELAFMTTQMLADNLVKQIQLLNKHLGHTSSVLNEELNKAYFLAQQVNSTLLQVTQNTNKQRVESPTRQPPKNLQLFNEDSPSPSSRRLSRSNCIKINNNTKQRQLLLSQHSTSSDDILLTHDINTLDHHAATESPNSFLDSSSISSSHNSVEIKQLSMEHHDTSNEEEYFLVLSSKDLTPEITSNLQKSLSLGNITETSTSQEKSKSHFFVYPSSSGTAGEESFLSVSEKAPKRAWVPYVFEFFRGNKKANKKEQ